jgi:hypothetical protein
VNSKYTTKMHAGKGLPVPACAALYTLVKKSFVLCKSCLASVV